MNFFGIIPLIIFFILDSIGMWNQVKEQLQKNNKQFFLWHFVCYFFCKFRKEKEIIKKYVILYVGAYHAIHRQKLFKHLYTEFPAYSKELQFLQGAYDKQTGKVDGHKYGPKFGVPQEWVNSPLLFNLALDYLLEEFRN